MPGTTPGIFLYVVFGTTAASRQKFKDKFFPESWQTGAPSSGGCCFGRRKQKTGNDSNDNNNTEGGIHVERSLTITSASRMRASQAYEDDDQFSDPSDISMSDLPKRPDSARSIQIMYMKPLPLVPKTAPISKFTTRTVCSNNTRGSPFSKNNNPTTSRVNGQPINTTNPTSHPAFGGGGGGGASYGLSAIEEKSSVGDVSSMHAGSFDLMTRTNTGDSLRVPDDYHGMGPEHSDDSGPILPIQRPEVRFAANIYDSQGDGREKTSRRDRLSKNFSRPRK